MPLHTVCGMADCGGVWCGVVGCGVVGCGGVGCGGVCNMQTVCMMQAAVKAGFALKGDSRAISIGNVVVALPWCHPRLQA
jgi:hypothetical protein